MFEAGIKGPLLGAAVLLGGHAQAQPATTLKQDIATARAAIAAELRDPASVQYRNVTVRITAVGKRMFCGELNSKNGFGGYSGYSRFMASGGGAVLMEAGPPPMPMVFANAYPQTCAGTKGVSPVQF